MTRSTEHYRGEAERCRRMASEMANAETKANLLDVAQQYEKLALKSRDEGR